ncbi:MAG: hypothetical protein K2I92_06655, partial [Muribaculaceae bacterium]|nr:hypothetical protein [Muribaculaceae bacterium]
TPRRFYAVGGKSRRFYDVGVKPRRFHDGGDKPRRFNDGGDKPRRFNDGGDKPRRFNDGGSYSNRSEARTISDKGPKLTNYTEHRAPGKMRSRKNFRNSFNQDDDE